MSLSIRVLDPSCDADLDDYFAFDRSVDEALTGGCDYQTLERYRLLASDTVYARRLRLIASEGGVVRGSALLELPLRENLDMAMFFVSVHPRLTNTRVAEALAEEAAAAAAGAGREKLSMWGVVPGEGDPDDPALLSNRIAARLGLSRKSLAVARVAPLPVPQRRLEQLGASVAARNGGYRVLTWRDRTPEEYLDAMCALHRQLDLDEPDEDYEGEVPDYTPERIRYLEQRRQDTGRAAIVAVAAAPGGELVAHSEVQFSTHPASTLAWQENTIVMPGHRGHGLGLTLKLASHAALPEAAPGIRQIVTWNSHVNPQMIAINEALGYRPRFREICYQP
ncbi:MAG: hypothetical protein Q3997_04125 [Propionibacteriaceae bacterium]|nr:hypothetical protein [Propionibacteriaceae bacterium]